MAAMSHESAFLLEPFDSEAAKKSGSLVVKFYPFTLAAGTVDVVTDFSYIQEAIPYYVGATAPAEAPAAAAVGGTVTVKGTGTNSGRIMVIGVLAAQG